MSNTKSRLASILSSKKSQIRILLIIIVTALATTTIAALHRKSEPPFKTTIEITTDTKIIPLSIELAQTSSQRARGLMHRTNLCENCGMLFIFPDETIRHFWMKNTLIPLDIIFFDEKGTIIHIEENTEPRQTQTRYSSEKPAQYVLEVNAHWCEQNEVEKGSRINLTELDKYTTSLKELRFLPLYSDLSRHWREAFTCSISVYHFCPPDADSFVVLYEILSASMPCVPPRRASDRLSRDG